MLSVSRRRIQLSAGADSDANSDAVETNTFSRAHLGQLLCY